MSVQSTISDFNSIDSNYIRQIIAKQRQFFFTGQTKDIAFRIAKLQLLKKIVIENQEEILVALKKDLNKPEFESYTAEYASLIQEINYVLKHIKKWTKPQKKSLPISFLPASAEVIPEPLGVSLIISPWNYPFSLALSPLVGAVAAGNCAIIKPSEFSPASSNLIAELISKNFPPAYICVIEGDGEVSQKILEEKFDRIFFTGSTAIGRVVMAAAAKHLTPLTLELGGKSPCILDHDIDIKVAARRITWGKFYNCGQSCIAPDYILIPPEIKQEFLEQVKICIREFYGENPIESPDYARIIGKKQFDRVVNLIAGNISSNIIIGGEINSEQLYIAPTIMDNVAWEDKIMEEEIFAPILPIIEYTDIDAVIHKINSLPKPLALYIFSKKSDFQNRILQETSSGSVCINDVIKQIGPSNYGFGGVGESGMGSYHGKASFDTFSHYKPVMKRPFSFDSKILYAPYQGKLGLLKKFMKEKSN